MVHLDTNLLDDLGLGQARAEDLPAEDLAHFQGCDLCQHEVAETRKIAEAHRQYLDAHMPTAERREEMFQRIIARVEAERSK